MSSPSSITEPTKRHCPSLEIPAKRGKAVIQDHVRPISIRFAGGAAAEEMASSYSNLIPSL